MTLVALAVAHVLFLWWFSTGAILFLDGLPRRTFPWTIGVATAILAAGLAGLWATRDDPSVAGAHIAFLCGVAVWAWNEILFLTGTLTGPRQGRCPDGARGWRHFRYAAESILWHEVAIVACSVALYALVGGAPNQVGLWTFVILWLMRLSTKLNVFLGVPNLSEEFLPEHLRYIASYFRRRPMNLLFPVSVTVSTVLFVLLVVTAAASGASPRETVASVILATLVALAVVEHWFLVLPIPSADLWKWGLRSHQNRRQPALQPLIDERRARPLPSATPSGGDA